MLILLWIKDCPFRNRLDAERDIHSSTVGSGWKLAAEEETLEYGAKHGVAEDGGPGCPLGGPGRHCGEEEGIMQPAWSNV